MTNDKDTPPPPSVWIQVHQQGFSAYKVNPLEVHDNGKPVYEYVPRAELDAKVAELEASKTYWQAEALLNHFCTEHASNKRQLGYYCTICGKPFAQPYQHGHRPLKYSEQQSRITALEAQLAAAEKLSKRVYGTIRGDVRAYHDEGDIGIPNGEPWVTEEESGQQWSCYDVEFHPDRERVATQAKFIVDQAAKHHAELSRQATIVAGLRAQLAAKAEELARARAEGIEAAIEIVKTTAKGHHAPRPYIVEALEYLAKQQSKAPDRGQEKVKEAK